MPTGSATPRFSQLYVYDKEEQLNHRHDMNMEMKRGTLQLLQDLMHEFNPFVHKYVQVIML